MRLDCYEKLVRNAEFMGLEVIEKRFKSSAKGLCKGNKIGISKDIETSVEKRCILIEEMAHSFFTVGNILDQNNILNIKQERFARKIAYEYLVTIPLLIDAYEQGLNSCFEIAEHLDVTEEFLKEALKHYHEKYGLNFRHGKYILCFSPLSISEGMNIAI